MISAGLPRLHVRAVLDRAEPAYGAVADVYRRAFPAGPTAVDPSLFATSLRRTRGRADVQYHLWAIAAAEGAPVRGMTAYFAMRRVGFLGYVVLEPPLRGRGLARDLIAMIEAQMVRDDLGIDTWFAECDLGSSQEQVFAALGFRRVPIRYFQPHLDEDLAMRANRLGPELALMCKALATNACTLTPPLDESLATILREVYRIPEPTESRCYRVAMGVDGVDGGDGA